MSWLSEPPVKAPEGFAWPCVLTAQKSSGSTEELILQTLLSLVSRKEGALALASVDDLSPLTEIAPSQPFALEILSLAWLQSMAASPEQREALSGKIDRAIDNLISSFKATDAVTLLAFLADLLRKLDPKVRINPPYPRFIPSETVRS